MQEKLTEEEVIHVARLARIEVSEEEIEKYQYQLKKLLDEVEKIQHVSGYDEELMINPTKEECVCREDEIGHTASFDDMKKNVPHTSGNLIEVPVMIHD